VLLAEVGDVQLPVDDRDQGIGLGWHWHCLQDVAKRCSFAMYDARS
jgi:hypothetical protein